MKYWWLSAWLQYLILAEITWWCSKATHLFFFPLCGCISMLSTTKIRATERMKRRATALASALRPSTDSFNISRMRVVSRVSSIWRRGEKNIMIKYLFSRKPDTYWNQISHIYSSVNLSHLIQKPFWHRGQNIPGEKAVEKVCKINFVQASMC